MSRCGLLAQQTRRGGADSLTLPIDTGDAVSLCFLVSCGRFWRVISLVFQTGSLSLFTNPQSSPGVSTRYFPFRIRSLVFSVSMTFMTFFISRFFPFPFPLSSFSSFFLSYFPFFSSRPQACGNYGIPISTSLVTILTSSTPLRPLMPVPL